MKMHISYLIGFCLIFGGRVVSNGATRIYPEQEPPSRVYVESDSQNAHYTYDYETGGIHNNVTDVSSWQDNGGGQRSYNYIGSVASCQWTVAFAKCFWPNLVNGTRTGGGNCYPPALTPLIGPEHCSVNDPENNVATMGDHDVYIRTAESKMKLFTGGRGVPARRNFFSITGWVSEIKLKRAQPPYVVRDFFGNISYPVGWNPIPGGLVTIGELGTSANGVLWKALPDGVIKDVTPRASLPFYWFNASATKLTLFTQCFSPIPTNQDRTTLGVGEVVYLGGWPGSWSTTAGSIASDGTFTAPSNACTATVTATFQNESCSVDFSVIEPTGYDHADITSTFSYGVGVSGAGMHLNVYLAPTTVSFNAVQIYEVGQPASDIAGYFITHPPSAHGDDQGANVWQPVGYDNLIGNGFDNAHYSGMPGSWNPGGGFTWHVPVLWKVGNGPSHSLTSWDQVFSLQANGTFTVSKFGRSVTRTINNVITTQ